MQKINGIILVTIAFLSSFFWGCSQEDDHYDSEMYTLAEQMETRTAEPGGGHKKKRIVFVQTPINTSLPKGMSSDSIPILDGEYDDETLSVFISDYSGSVDVYVLALPLNQVMSYDGATFVDDHQFDFSLTGYPHGATYQVYIGLDNGDAYAGEFDL